MYTYSHPYIRIYTTWDHKCTTKCSIFFHGNALNIGIRLYNAHRLYDEVGCNILLVDYRGYGDSDDASPSEYGLKLDCHAVVQHAIKDLNDTIDTTKLFIFGRSLGGACAIYTGTQYVNEIRG